MLEAGFTPVSEKWPGYAKLVLFIRKNGTTGIGMLGDNGVYFGDWGGDYEDHINIFGWKPLHTKE